MVEANTEWGTGFAVIRPLGQQMLGEDLFEGTSDPLEEFSEARSPLRACHTYRWRPLGSASAGGRGIRGGPHGRRPRDPQNLRPTRDRARAGARDCGGRARSRRWTSILWSVFEESARISRGNPMVADVRRCGAAVGFAIDHTCTIRSSCPSPALSLNGLVYGLIPTRIFGPSWVALTAWVLRM